MLKPYESYKEIDEKWFNEYPDNWQIKRIKEIFKERKERNSPIKTQNILSLSAKNGVQPYSERTDKGGNKPKEDISKYNVAHENDLLVNCMNIVSGAAGVSKWTGAISPVYYALILRNSDDNIWFYNYVFRLFTFQRSLLGLGKGILMHQTENGKLNTVRMRISMDSFNNVNLPKPPKVEQDQIVKYLDWQTSNINRLINAKKKQIELLKEQRQAIINKAVTKGIDDSMAMKDSGVEWLGQIPKSWRISRLRKVCEINASISQLTYKYDDFDKIVFLPMSNVSTKGEIDCSEKRLFKDVRSGFSSFAKNDVIVAKITPCFENGKGAYLDKLETEIGYGSTEFITLRNKEHILPEYLYFITMTSYFRKIGADNMTGSAGQKRVSSDFISNFTLGIPNIDEQRDIIDFINASNRSIDTIVEKTIKELELLNEYKTSLISSVVTGKVDVRDIEVPAFEVEEELVENDDIEELEEMEV